MSQLINKSIIKAMTIGLSAVMTFSSVNLATFADDNVGGAKDGGDDDQNKLEVGTTDTKSALMLALETSNVKNTADNAVQELDQAVEDEAGLEVRTENFLDSKGKEVEGTIPAAENLALELRNDSDANVSDATDVMVTSLEKDTTSEDGDTTSEDNDQSDVSDDNQPIIVGADSNEKTTADLSDMAEKLEGSAQTLDTIDTNIKVDVKIANDNADKGNAAAEKADGLVEDAEKIVGTSADSTQTLEEVVGEKAQIVEDADKTINGATTTDEADGAIQDARDAAGEADKAVNDAQNAIDRINAEFTQAENDYIAAKAAWDAAVDRLTLAKKNFELVQGNADAQAEAMIGTTNENGETVTQGEIDRLMAEAEDLKAAANAAKDKFNAAGYAKIAVLEQQINDKIEKRKTDKTVQAPSWEEYRELVGAIMQFHVLKDGEEFISLDWQTDMSAYSYKEINEKGKEVTKYLYEFADGSTTDQVGDILRYGLLKYKDDKGDIQYRRVNYKAVDSNNRAEQGIIIFDMTKHVEINHTEVPDAAKGALKTVNDKYEVVDEAGKTVGIYVLVRTDKDAKTGEDVPVYGYFDVTGNGTVNDNATVSSSEGTWSDWTTDSKNANLQTQTKTEVVVSNNKTVVYTKNTDGSVTKTEKADVTTTTYTNSKLSGTVAKFKAEDSAAATATTKYTTSDASKAAFISQLQGVIDSNSFGANDVLEIGTYKFKKGDNIASYLAKNNLDATALGYEEDSWYVAPVVTGYTLNVDYNSKFTSTTTVSGTKEHLGNLINPTIDKNEAYDAFEDAAKEEIKNQKKTYSYADGIGNNHDQMETCYISASYSDIDDADFTSDETNKKHHVETIDIPFVGEVILNEYDTWDRTYSGNVTVEYGKLCSDIHTFTGNAIENWWNNGWYSFDDAKADLAAKGITGVEIAGIDKIDGNKYACTVYYYIDNASKQVTISGSSKDAITDDTVKAALKGAALEITDDTVDKINVSYDKDNATANTTQAITYYGYKALDYLITNSTSSSKTVEAQTVSEMVYSTLAGGESKTEYRNDNWFEGDDLILAEYGNTDIDYVTGLKSTKDGKTTTKKETVTLTQAQRDEAAAFRKNVADAAAIAQQYVDLAQQAKDAQDALTLAKNQVIYLQGQISNLNPDINTKILRDFSAKLTAAQQVLIDATKDRDDLLKRLAEVEEDYNNKIAELTKKNDDENNNQNNNENTNQNTDGDATQLSDRQEDDGNDNANTDDNANADGNADGGNADGGNADGGNADGGNADGGNADGGNADGGNADGGNAGGGNADGGAAGGNDGGADNGADNGDGDGNVTIEGDQTALAEGLGDGNGDANGNGNGNGNVTIEGDQTALSEGLDTIETHKKWNWWWLVFVALITGGTTYGIIKGNQRKKEKIQKSEKTTDKQ